MSENSLDLLALSLVPGLGDRNVKQLISYCGSTKAVFESSKKKLESIPGFGSKTASIILNHKTHSEAESILKEAEKKNMEVISYLDSAYPQKLKLVIDAPTILYKKGNGDLNPPRSIAVVGTRRATDYGKEATRKIVDDLKALGAQVVSGLAYGIDIESHRAALKNGNSTVAVLAGGLDRIYPSVHKKNAEEMQENGAIISESRPDTKPDPHLFPARNRIIAGMSDATIVVEAAERGGALITAKIADSYGRTVFAVPGDLVHTYSAGTNKLISTQMALIYTGMEDLKYHLNWEETDGAPAPVKKPPALTDEEKKVYDLLEASAGAMEIDQIAIKSQIPINQLASLLLNLEFKNVVRNYPGKKYGLV